MRGEIEYVLVDRRIHEVLRHQATLLGVRRCEVKHLPVTTLS